MVCFKTNVPQNVPQKENLEQIIIQEVKKNNKVTRQEIADVANVSIKTVARQLKNMPYLKYVGSAKSGHWEFE